MVAVLNLMVFWGIFFLLPELFVQGDQYELKRKQMVKQQIEARGVSDQLVLDAMRSVPRHLFVAAGYEDFAYLDRPLPIGYGQTISQPYIVAYMTELIRPEPSFKVLEIGTGSGYQAAVLAGIVDKVYTIELVDALAKQATGLLEKLNYNNVQVKSGDGYVGWIEHAPYDAIIVTAAADSVPPPLLEQLKIGGRMVIPVKGGHDYQYLQLLEKKENRVVSRNVIPVRFVPFIHKD
ncbi:protein-L-isoaspartate(D-aspartate) O-methyltransferase [Mangrovibacterium sp.]|uniref:protein-L-isoaspartate(D-aspartate) O-methyltransferase n=1 Tax=Mangrovibacterium sp. TaxID=1961364 RepID=UPI0035614D94